MNTDTSNSKFGNTTAPHFDYLVEATNNGDQIDGKTTVVCVHCLTVYQAIRSDFKECDESTLICNQCNVDAVVPLKASSSLYGLTHEKISEAIIQGHERGFGSLMEDKRIRLIQSLLDALCKYDYNLGNNAVE